nr:DMT family transporter [Paenalcaligenes hominis]
MHVSDHGSRAVHSGIGSNPTATLVVLNGGVIGAGLVFTSIFLAPKLGVANMLFFMVLGQIICGLLIDHFGLLHMPVREISWNKIVGLFIMIAGLSVFVFGKR